MSIPRESRGVTHVCAPRRGQMPQGQVLVPTVKVSDLLWCPRISNRALIWERDHKVSLESDFLGLSECVSLLQLMLVVSGDLYSQSSLWLLGSLS